MKPTPHLIPLLTCAALIASASTGCRSLGPRTIPKDRADYSESIGDSWMRQTLLNIVKLRYHTPPIFVDVASIVGGYSAETELGGGINFGGLLADTKNLSGAIRYIDRPTITYTPLTGNKFIRGLIIPIRPEELFFSLQAGWNAEAILGAGLASINGLRNRETTGTGVAGATSEFLRALELMGKLQSSGLVGIRIIQDDQNGQSTVLTLHDEKVTGEVLNDVRELRLLLRLHPEAHEFNLIFGNVPASDLEVAVRTRSLIQIMSLIAAEMEVPMEHIEEGRTVPGPEHHEKPLVPVRCTSDKPKDALVAVKYRGHWFWVDDRDVRAKRGFSFLMLLFTLADTGEQQVLPLVTIPAQ